VNLYDPPTPSNAGSGQTICGTVATMAANTPVAGIGTWTQVSGPNAASFTSVILPTTTVTGLIEGNYVFRWTIKNGTVCDSSTSTVAIVVHENPGAPLAGPDQRFCETTPPIQATLAGNTISPGTGQWSQAATDPVPGVTFSNAASPTAIATFPGYGTYHLVWTASKPYTLPAPGTCTLTDTVTIQVDRTPTVADAGPDISTCRFAPVFLAGTAPSVGTGTWSVDPASTGPGSPTFVSPHSPTTQVLGTSVGIYLFNWIVSNGVCLPDTDQVQVTILNFPPIAIAGSNKEICNGTSVQMNGNYPGVSPNFGTWSQTDGPVTVSFTDPNSPTTMVTGITAQGIYTVRWTVSNGGCSSFDEINITKYPDVALTCPENQTICDGGTATLSVSATGGSGTYVYTWESGPSATGPWTLIPSATGNSYTTPALSSDTWYRITETCGQQTCTVKVTVVPDPSINSYSSNLTICSGATANLSVSATGGTPGLSYQWYTGATCGGTTTLIAGATNVSYTTPSLTQTTYYRAVVSATGNGCNTVFTGCIGVFVPVITQQPQGTVLCSGGTHTMTVAASSGGGTETYTYQWQLSPTNSPYAWSNVTGGTGGNSPSYTTPVLSTGDYYYRCVISIIGPVGCADLESSPAYVQAFNDPVVADQTTSRQICKGTSTSLSVTVTGGTGTLSYQWQSGTKSTPPEAMNCGEVDTWTNVTGGSGANTASYTTPVLNTAGIYFYRCFITQTGVGCGPVISACIPVTVDPIPNAVPTPSSQSICSGTASSTVVLTSAVPGTTFAWTRTTPAGITTSQPVSGSGDITGATFTNSTSAPVTVTYTITPTGPAPTFCVGSPVTATVTVSPIPSVTSASSKTVCNNTNIAYTPTSAVSGTTFAWSASVITGTVTGYSATGSGAITDVLNNTGTSLATVQYSITPTGPAPTYCVGSAFNFNAHVEPTPDVIATPSTRTFCSGGNTAITLTTNVPGTTFYYAAPVITPGGSGAVTGWSSRTSPGNTNGINDVLVNTTAAIQTVTYTVYPIINGCVGTSITVVITVNPVPVITSNQEVNVCANASGIASVNYAITTTPSMSGALFLWPLPGEDPPLTGGTGRPVASSANLQDTYNNGGATTILNAVYPVTPVAPASLGSCQGNMTIVTVHVIPFPVASATPSGPTICSGSQTGISLSSNLTLPLYADFTWTAALQSGTATGFSGGSGTSINQTLSNTSSSPAVVR